MFNIGPLEFLVLAAVALMVFGPEKLPQITKDAARMIRTLRDMAQGAKTQLTSELGPEFANFDLNSLNPKTAIRNALLSEGETDFSSMNPRDALQRALRGEDDAPLAPQGHPMTEAAAGHTPGTTAPLETGEAAPYDYDAT